MYRPIYDVQLNLGMSICLRSREQDLLKLEPQAAAAYPTSYTQESQDYYKDYQHNVDNW